MIFINFIIPNYDLCAHKPLNIINSIVLHRDIFTFQSMQSRAKGVANQASAPGRQNLQNVKRRQMFKYVPMFIGDAKQYSCPGASMKVTTALAL